jgi:hypothetical protein
MSMHIMFGPDGAVTAVRLSPVPPHSPYQAGDWVRKHGYPGEMPGPRQWGWRGFVLGSLGATILRGLTDDGQEWAEYWGRLVPDGDPSVDGRCVCCPRRPAGPRVEQLGLFAVADLFGTRS